MHSSLSKAQEESIEKLVRQVFRLGEQTKVGDLAAKNFAAWDSLRQVELGIRVQEEFELQLSTQELLQLTSVEELKRILSTRLKGD